MLDEPNLPAASTDYLRGPVSRSTRKLSLAVDILSVAAATPNHKVSQAEAFERVKRVTSTFTRLAFIYTGSGIETRYSCVTPDCCEQPHGWGERMAVYQKEALVLLENVARKSVAEAGLTPQNINVIVTNSTTGRAVPSMDALMINRLKLKQTVTRLPIFGFGCSGGAAGLARAAQFAHICPTPTSCFSLWICADWQCALTTTA